MNLVKPSVLDMINTSLAAPEAEVAPVAVIDREKRLAELLIEEAAKSNARKANRTINRKKGNKL